MRNGLGEVNRRSDFDRLDVCYSPSEAVEWRSAGEVIGPCCGCQVPPEARVECLLLAKDSFSTRRGDRGSHGSEIAVRARRLRLAVECLYKGSWTRFFDCSVVCVWVCEVQLRWATGDLAVATVLGRAVQTRGKAQWC